MGTTAGIDPSTKTGYATCVDGIPLTSGTIVYPPTPGDDRSVAARVLRITMPTLSLIREIGRPSVVCIEQYSYGSNGANHSILIEIGYEIRRALTGTNYHPRIYEVAPTTLKKWATGRGVGDKVAVASALSKRYGVSFASSDEADAFALAMMAAQIDDESLIETEIQRECIAKVLSGAVKKPKKKRARKGDQQ